jgi:hypothetical protein
MLFPVARERIPGTDQVPPDAGYPRQGNIQEQDQPEARRPASEKETKETNFEMAWGCWLNVEPPCKRPPWILALKDAIPPSPANGSRLAAQKLPAAGTADLGSFGYDGAEASIRSGAMQPCCLRLTARARTVAPALNSMGRITREPPPNVMRIAEPRQRSRVCTSSSSLPYLG